MKASDLSESAILQLLSERAGVAHTHWEEYGPMPRVYDPTHPDAPIKVLAAKLRGLVRRGLIRGCTCGCRGDWQVDGDHRREDENRCPYCGALGEPNGCADCAAEAYERGEHRREEAP